MYNRGLEVFMHNKQLKSQDTINQFLQSEGITEFTAKNHIRVNNYIEKHWTKFASFVDSGIKSGKLKGKAVKLNHYFDEQREWKEKAKAERNLLTDEENKLYNIIRRFDDSWGKVTSFFAKRGINLPKNNEGITKAVKTQPKLITILNSEYYEEFLEHVKNTQNETVNT